MVISNGKEELSLIGFKWPPTTANSGDRQREKGEDAVEQFHTKKDQVSVEVGRVWLELPSPIILLNQIQAVFGNPIQLGL